MYPNIRGASVLDRISREPGATTQFGRQTTKAIDPEIDPEIQKLTDNLEKAKKELAARAAHAAAAAEGSGTEQELYEIAREAHDAARNELARREMALENQLKLKNKVEAEKNSRERAEKLENDAREDLRNMSLEEKKKYLGEWKGMNSDQRNKVAQKGF